MRRALACLLLGLAVPHAHAEPMAQVPGFGGQTLYAPVTSMKGLRSTATVLQKYDFSCGSAAVATLLSHHYGRPTTEQEVLVAMYAKGDQEKIRKEGFSLLDMKRYLEGLGYAADGFQQTLDRLAQARLPAIVLIRESSYLHFVVVKGMREGRVLLGDPARGTRAMAREDFEKLWVGGLLFVIHSHVPQARFNQASDWRVAPPSPMASGVLRDVQPGTAFPRNEAGDF